MNNNNGPYIKLMDNKWYWPSRDTNCWPYLQARKDVPKNVSSFVKNKNVVIQAGGNCGFYTKQYAEIFKTVYTFEPDEINFNCLCLNLLNNLNVYKIQSCLGSTNQTVELEMHELDCGGHNIGKYGPHVGQIPMFRIDDLNLKTLDLIQLDIEGYEIEALKGGIETIKRFRPVICVEIVWCDPTDLILSLGGYTKQRIDDGDWIFIPE